MTTNAKTTTVPENGETVFIPLNKLKKHPKNARKTPHSEASIEGKAIPSRAVQIGLARAG